MTNQTKAVNAAAVLGNATYHLERVQAAQLNRTAQAMRLTDAEVMAAFRAMPADRAYRLAHQALSETIARAMQAAHERGV